MTPKKSHACIRVIVYVCVCVTVHVFLPMHLCSGSPNLLSEEWAINKRRVVWNMQKTVNGPWRIKSKFSVCLQFLRCCIRVDIFLLINHKSQHHTRFQTAKTCHEWMSKVLGLGSLVFILFLIFERKVPRWKETETFSD